MFAWPVCNNSLPNNQRIASRIEGHFPYCPCCAEEIETDVHVLRDCVHSRAVWENFEIPTDIPVDSGLDWIHGLATNLSKKDFSLALIIMWEIWNRRNFFVFEGSFKTSECVARDSKALLEEVWKGPLAEKEKKQHPVTKWTPPKCWVD